MNDSTHQSIIFCKSNCNDDIDLLFDAVKRQLQLLLEQNCIAVVRYDEPGVGIISIEYEHDDNLDAWGVYNPMWVSPEEQDLIYNYREGNTDEE